MKQINGYTIFYILGVFLLCESFLLFATTGVSVYYGEDAVAPLGVSAFLTLVTGFIFRFISKKHYTPPDKRAGYLLVSLIWIVMSVFGSLPFYLGEYVPSYVNAFFETMSGFTTTGATIFEDVEALPRGILMWRAVTHLTGGIGIVVVVLPIIPSLGGGGFSLFSAEVAGPFKDKFRPKIKHTAISLIKIYVLITLSFILLFILSGMDVFESVCTSFSIAGTGGFLTTNDSIAGFSTVQQYLVVFCMFIAGMNFTLIYRFFRGERNIIRKNEELKYYFIIVVVSALVLTVGLLYYHDYKDVELALRESLIHVLSFMTTTGVVATDYTLWADPILFLFLLLLFTGAMSGSTCGGLKMVRIVVLFKNAKQIFAKTLRPGVAYDPLRLNGKVIGYKMLYNVLSIFLLYLVTSIVGTLLLVSIEGDIKESMGAVVSCINNVGPGLGKCGGFGNYGSLSSASKWILSACMYLGRLEIASVLILFSSHFRKR